VCAREHDQRVDAVERRPHSWEAQLRCINRNSPTELTKRKGCWRRAYPNSRSDERRPRGGSQANASTRLDGVQGFFCGDGLIYGLRDSLDSLIRLRQQPREQFILDHQR
jgi:hypothetical protein